MIDDACLYCGQLPVSRHRDHHIRWPCGMTYDLDGYSDSDRCSVFMDRLHKHARRELLKRHMYEGIHSIASAIDDNGDRYLRVVIDRSTPFMLLPAHFHGFPVKIEIGDKAHLALGDSTA